MLCLHLPTYFHRQLIRWRSLCMRQLLLTRDNFYFERACLMLHFPQRSKNIIRSKCMISVRNVETLGFCPLQRWIYYWLRNSMLTALLGGLPANVIHAPTILTLRTSASNAYMSIHSHRMITSSPLSTLELWVLINYAPTHFHSLPSTSTHSHPLLSTPNHSHPFPSTPIYFQPLLLTRIYSHPLPPTPTHFQLLLTHSHSFSAHSHQLLLISSPYPPSHTHSLCVLRVYRL